jgi:hypothetical protein
LVVVGSTSAKPRRIDSSLSDAVFLRSFDRVEEILEEALMLELGKIAEAFVLRERVRHLQRTGFLTAMDLGDWADCLAIRRSFLLASTGQPAPSSQAVEGGLARMLQLQVTLTDRRRALFNREQAIGQQEDAALRRAAAECD